MAGRVKKSRIVNVCLNSKCAVETDTKERNKILKKVVEDICNGLREPVELDAILFPGCFWQHSTYIGNRSYRDRKAELGKTKFSEAVVREAKKLETAGFGTPLIVAGVDTVQIERKKAPGFDIRMTKYYKKARAFNKRPQNKEIHGDQLCVAWSAKGIVGIGRKVFPVAPELYAKEPEDFPEDDAVDAPYYVTYAKDFCDPKRVVELSSGRKAVLCACYDIFGCSERYSQNKTRTKMIEWLVDESGRVIHLPDEKDITRNYVEQFQKLIDDVDTALVAAHSFDRGSKANYFERHGIAAASAALNSGMVVGAAHFKKCLPSKSDIATLVANNVPKSYLKIEDKRKRKLKKLPKNSGKIITDSCDILIRLYECP